MTSQSPSARPKPPMSFRSSTGQGVRRLHLVADRIEAAAQAAPAAAPEDPGPEDDDDEEWEVVPEDERPQAPAPDFGTEDD